MLALNTFIYKYGKSKKMLGHMTPTFIRLWYYICLTKKAVFDPYLLQLDLR